MEINLDNNQLTIDLKGSGPRTKAQKRLVSELIRNTDVSSLMSYLMSFQKFSPHWKYFQDLKRTIKSTGVDLLSSKDDESVLRQLEQSYRLNGTHVPINEGPWIGVEIECLIPYQTGVEGQSDLKRLFQDRKVQFSSIKSDGSIHAEDGYFGVEITVLTRLDRPETLRKVCSILNEIRARVNRSCGLHVHLDARPIKRLSETDRKRELKRISRNFERSLPVLLRMVPESRRSNTYCMPRVSKLNGSRYCAVNMTAFQKYKTIEVRLHSSTTSFDKIIQWAQLVHSIMHAPTIPVRCSDINDLETHIKISAELMEYVAQRTARFNGESSSLSAVDTDTLSA